jgi:flagellar assembly protein FliH
MEAFAFPVLEAAGGILIRAGDLAEATGDILALARVEGEQIRAAAAVEGREEGYAAGLAEAREALVPARAALEAAARGIVDAHQEFIELAEGRAVELALALAEKVIGVTLEVRPELVVELATGALRRAAERDHVVLLVNPDDLQVVRDAAGDLSATLGGIRRFEIVPERRIVRGGCLVQTAEGEIDATVETQLERAREVLTAELQPAPDA